MLCERATIFCYEFQSVYKIHKCHFRQQSHSVYCQPNVDTNWIINVQCKMVGRTQIPQELNVVH